MSKTLKVLTTLLIVTTISGCSVFKDRVREPLCLPARPVLEDISGEEQAELFSVNRDAMVRIASNDIRLKNHIKTIEEITEAHNEQFKAKCAN